MKQVIDKTTDIVEEYKDRNEAIQYLLNFSKSSKEKINDFKNDIVFLNETPNEVDSIIGEAMKLNGESVVKIKSFPAIMTKYGFTSSSPYTWVKGEYRISKNTIRNGSYKITISKNHENIFKMNYVKCESDNEQLENKIKTLK